MATILQRMSKTSVPDVQETVLYLAAPAETPERGCRPR
jgi:hypothetical protein